MQLTDASRPQLMWGGRFRTLRSDPTDAQLVATSVSSMALAVRFDQPEVPVVPAIQHAHPLASGVAEDDEGVLRPLHLEHRLVDRHRLDRVAAGADDPRPVAHRGDVLDRLRAPDRG